MTEPVLRPVAGGVNAAGHGFEVSYLAQDGAAHRIGLADAWWIRFESCRPARVFPSTRGRSIFRAGGGQRRWAAISAMSRGWNVIT